MENSGKRVPLALAEEDSYDSEGQSDISLTSSRNSGANVRRGLLGMLLSIVIILASAIAITTMRKGLTKTQGEYVYLASQKPYEIQAGVGCSDWKDVMVGSMQRATSALDCLNKCSALTGSKFANYQEEECDAYNGAYAGACYCFSDCKTVNNTCWDLVHTSAPAVVTKLTTPVPAGATSIDLGSEEGSYKIGDKVTFTGGGHSESKTIIGMASILLDSPLTYSYPAGATISTGSQDSPVPEEDSPTPPVTPAPTPAPIVILTETATETTTTKEAPSESPASNPACPANAKVVTTPCDCSDTDGNKDCAEHKWCWSGKCVPACSSDAKVELEPCACGEAFDGTECAVGKWCVSGECISTCQDNVQVAAEDAPCQCGSDATTCAETQTCDGSACQD